MYSHFYIEDGRKYTVFPAYYALLFQKKVKIATEMQKKICALHGEGPVTDRTCQKCFAKFLQISRWAMLHGWVDQLKLVGIKLRH